jgi:signal transduction histidine kinase
MSEEQLAHLFEPFYTTKTNGTGLGMNIVKSIIEAHKGKIAVTSQPGQGTTVEIKLQKSSSRSFCKEYLSQKLF